MSSAGFCLPEDAQKEWDRLNGKEAALAEVSDDEAQSNLVGGAEGSSEEGPQGTFFFVNIFISGDWYLLVLHSSASARCNRLAVANAAYV